jgi:hypothetical protein
MNSSPARRRAAEIANLNDAFLRSTRELVLTSGIAELSPLVEEILRRVRRFDEFSFENDPYYEHDFGSFSISGVSVIWKIDYSDQSLSYWCDPLDTRCRRVLTVMRAEEYQLLGVLLRPEYDDKRLKTN